MAGLLADNRLAARSFAQSDLLDNVRFGMGHTVTLCAGGK